MFWAKLPRTIRNRRDADYYELNGTLYRNVYKDYGLRFVVDVKAKMWQLDLIVAGPFLITWLWTVLFIAGVIYAFVECIFKLGLPSNEEEVALVNRG